MRIKRWFKYPLKYEGIDFVDEEFQPPGLLLPELLLPDAGEGEGDAAPDPDHVVSVGADHLPLGIQHH